MIDHDPTLDRTYIPLVAGWEVQTKGNGSTFRIARDGCLQRFAVLDEHLHEPLETLARDVHTELERLRSIETAVRNLLDRADGHYMVADDIYCLQTALSYGEEELPTAPKEHHTRIEGDEYACHECGKRWGVDDPDVPPCD